LICSCKCHKNYEQDDKKYDDERQNFIKDLKKFIFENLKDNNEKFNYKKLVNNDIKLIKENKNIVEYFSDLKKLSKIIQLRQLTYEDSIYFSLFNIWFYKQINAVNNDNKTIVNIIYFKIKTFIKNN
jgi:hypothetical protein